MDINDVISQINKLEKKVDEGFKGVYIRMDKTNGLVLKDKEWIDQHHDIDDNIEYAISLTSDKYSSTFKKINGISDKMNIVLSQIDTKLKQCEDKNCLKINKLQTQFNSLSVMKFKITLIWGIIVAVCVIIGNWILNKILIYI